MMPRFILLLDRTSILVEDAQGIQILIGNSIL